MNDKDLHTHLIGRQGGRASLNTPALVIELDVLKANIVRMAAFAKANRLALRPHAKTHKSADIARLQVEAGAVGVCCAKIGEAEAIADERGADSILITSPVVTPQAIERLVALNARLPDLRVVADHPDNVAAIARAMKGQTKKLNMLVDVDPGIRRTGVSSADAAVALAKAIKAEPSLNYIGVQFYCGREQHVASFEERKQQVGQRFDYLRTAIAALEAVGSKPAVVTGGGTGTHVIDAGIGVLNELQAGSYVFMDKQYLDCDIQGGDGEPFPTSLFIDASVVSANTPGMATLDSGFKSMSTDGGSPAIQSGAPADAKFFFMGDEHGAVLAPGSEFHPGDRVVLTAPHCDPTVNLYDWYHVVRGDTLVDIWPVQARGRSR